MTYRARWVQDYYASLRARPGADQERLKKDEDRALYWIHDAVANRKAMQRLNRWLTLPGAQPEDDQLSLPFDPPLRDPHA